MEFGKAIKHYWLLDDNITFLNNGSFGAAPENVINEAESIYRRLETQPVTFFMDSYASEIRNCAKYLASFVGCNADNLVFVDNATSGVNVVLRSIMPMLKPNDEILINNHTYPAVKAACSYISEISGCKVVEMQIPFPIDDESELISAYSNSLTPRTKLIIIDHIMYTTGMINPVREIAKLAKQNNTFVLIDGAHAPGMIELNIQEIGADWYTGNCHKWLYAPKGCALLWTSPEHQKWTKPLSISFFHGQGYTSEFDWTGTKNPTPFLAINKAIDFHRSLDSNRIYSYNHNLALETRSIICSEMQIAKPIPDNMLGALVTLPLPGNHKAGHQISSAIRKRFLDKYRIEMPIIEFDNKLYFRYSVQVYNEISDYLKLLDALKDFAKEYS